MYTLLYVDDEPDLLNLCRLFLEKGGDFSVTTVSSAEEGLQKLSAGAFDAVISDYQMPDMDGIEFLKQVRSVHGDIPFILFTGRGREEVVIEAINNGADFYLQKGGAPGAQFAEMRHKLLIALERRQVADALRSENEKNRGLMDYASDAIFIIDCSTGAVVDANRKALEVTGRTAEELRSAGYLSLHPAEHQEQYRAEYENAFREGPRSLTLVMSGNGGRHIPVLASTTVVDLGGRRCMMGIYHDISEIKMSQDAIQLANRKLNLLADITRHDIRNKLTVIGGYLDLIRDRPREPEYSMYIRKIISTLRVVSENIEFSKLYQNLGVTAPVWQNVHEVFFHACTHIDFKNVTVQSDCGNLEIFADPLLERAFFNFVENSLQHGGKVTVIRIRARESEGGTVTISIEDNGTGIPPFEKATIFTRGYGRNTGLGLFLVQEILSITGIAISETGEYHKGARFELRVPEGAFRYPRHDHVDRCHILTPTPDNS